eukprot:3387929-Amphidinium_carterae.1
MFARFLKCFGVLESLGGGEQAHPTDYSMHIIAFMLESVMSGTVSLDMFELMSWFKFSTLSVRARVFDVYT